MNQSINLSILINQSQWIAPGCASGQTHQYQSINYNNSTKQSINRTVTEPGCVTGSGQTHQCQSQPINQSKSININHNKSQSITFNQSSTINHNQ